MIRKMLDLCEVGVIDQDKWINYNVSHDVTANALVPILSDALIHHV